ncbi:MAG: aldehyde ferredoxin oxidoreductase family protein [bacterium]|nr:aldehyde ferredoxin oxidoreductase family protein [bacterium]
MNSFAGQILWIDLSAGISEKKAIDPALIKNWLGGRGINAKLLWDLTKPGIDPLGPDNPIIFGTGAFSGTFAPSSGRLSITCKSPATNLYLKTNVGSHFAAELKFAGYDFIVVSGSSERPVYLWIDNDQVTLRDASHLWGLDTRATDQEIKEELGDNQLKMLMIGPAGENLVKFAAVMASIYRAAGRGGAGAVMGAKKLKAIVVRGTGDLHVAHPEAFQKTALGARRSIREDEYCWSRSYLFGTAQGIMGANEGGTLPHRNFQDGFTPGGYKLSGEYVSDTYAHPEGCSACVFHCGRFSRVTSGKYKGSYSAGPEYETLASLGSKCDITDTEAILRGNELCDILGMDTISAGSLVSFAMECYEAGILTDEDTGGMPIQFGDADTMLKLLEMLAYRRGIGDLLAEGAKIAAEKLGEDAHQFAIQAKGLEQSMVDVRGSMAYALSFALNPRGPDHLMTECLATYGYTPEVRDLAIQMSGTEEAVNPVSPDGKPAMVAYHEDVYAITDCVGLCAFTSTWSYRMNFENIADIYHAATGLDFSPDDLRTIGEKIITLERCFNLREGFQPFELDVLPSRMFMPSKTIRHGEVTLTPEMLQEMLKSYYGLRQWDIGTGKPTPAKLKMIGLEEVAGAIGHP